MVEILFRELTREEDMEISRLDGYDDGLEEGLRKGRAAATLELAKAMKRKGLDNAAIKELTGLSADEIEVL